MVSSPRSPHYRITDLVNDCSKPGAVRVIKSARADAKYFFNLETESRIISFVSTGDFTDIKHDNTDELKQGHDIGSIFDAYIFRIGPKHVYFAFYKKPNGLWIIKSFHPPDFGEKAPPLTHNPFKDLLGGLRK